MNRFLRGLARGFRRTSKRARQLTVRRHKGETYVDRVMYRLDAGRVHASLGPNLKKGSAERARVTLDKMIDKGLKPEHVVVDFGCGTLRVGVALIEFLAPECYVGLDIDQRFLDLGRQMLPPGLDEAKRPILRVISAESIAEVAVKKPDWIFSGGVMQHVPPEELGTYFGNISALATDRTKIEVRVSKLKPASERISINTWSHALPEVEQAVKMAGLSLKTFRTRSGKDGTLRLEKN